MAARSIEAAESVRALPKLAIAEAETAVTEVTTIPAGYHAVLDQTRLERRAPLPAQLREVGDAPAFETDELRQSD
jgi:hypothetical protein